VGWKLREETKRGTPWNLLNVSPERPINQPINRLTADSTAMPRSTEIWRAQRIKVAVIGLLPVAVRDRHCGFRALVQMHAPRSRR
jgi:hypothetical protein